MRHFINPAIEPGLKVYLPDLCVFSGSRIAAGPKTGKAAELIRATDTPSPPGWLQILENKGRLKTKPAKIFHLRELRPKS
jgi:hypothetical protein